MAKRCFIQLASRNNKFSIFLIAFILFSVYCFVFSESGILERMQLQKEIADIQLQIIQKQSEIKKFRELTNKGNPNNLLLKESINAGYIPQGAKVFEFKDKPKEPPQIQTSQPLITEKFTQYIQYGRILWVIFSVLIITGMLLYYRNRNQL
ncbi:MAG TPA: hypothetical protein PLV81_14905 [Spirochaetota bacterium]|nr:hypothetical protein [Spirochaetota bacterium]